MRRKTITIIVTFLLILSVLIVRSNIIENLCQEVLKMKNLNVGRANKLFENQISGKAFSKNESPNTKIVNRDTKKQESDDIKEKEIIEREESRFFEKQATRNKDIREDEKYIGEVLDVVDYVGEAKVYLDKSKNSDIIYKLKDYDKVVLLETLPYGWYKVKLKDGRVGYVDACYIRARKIPPHNYDQNSKEWVLIFSNEDQTLEIYRDGKLVQKSLASGGIWDSFTPKGVFKIESGRRGTWAYIPRFKQGMKYWVGFKDTYLLHSVPYNQNHEVIQEEAIKLGQPSSHGCIRLPVEMSKYIYENVPDGSLVIIK